MGSAYWLSMAQSAKKEEALYTEQKNQLQSYLSVLNSANSEMSKTFNNMKSAESNYQRGGFNCEGEILGKGTLKNCYEILTIDEEVLNDVISKVISDIQELEAKIKEAKAKYEFYMQKYYEALEAERRAAEEEAARQAAAAQVSRISHRGPR